MQIDKEKPKISVIVPVYNSEPYIAGCLNSILEQTFENFEVICIDDATPDKSTEIIREFVERDGRVRLIQHDKNRGLGGARNTGIKAAEAEFIASVDSDDSLKPKMLERLWEGCDNGFFDIVVCGFDRIDENGEVISTQHSGDKKLRNEGQIDVFSAMNPAFWNKLWRKALFVQNDIWFPDHLYYQDTATTPRILTKARNIRFIPDSLYNYLERADSISTTASPKHLIDYFKVFDVILEFLENEGLDAQRSDAFLKYVDRSIAHHANIGARRGVSEDEQAQYLRHLLAFKTGYIENRQLVADKSVTELVRLLEKVRTKSDLLPPDGRPILPISIIVKTFLRPAILERFLMSVGHYEQKAGIRFSEVLVGDDSPKVELAANVRAIKKAQDFFPDLKIIHHTYEENIGLSDGRNRLVKVAREKFVLLCDDDFILDEEADIAAALAIAEKGEFQIVGGWLKNNYDIKTGGFTYWGAFGELCETKEELVININEKPIEKDDLHSSEYLLNFFVAERAALLENPWNEQLKVEEHQDFFFRFKKAGFKAALFGALFVKHTADRRDNPPRYNEYRFSKKNWERFLFAAPKAMGKIRRTINRVRPGSYERWTVDANARTTTQNTVQLCEPIIGQSVKVEPISPPYQQFFGGYYDIQLMSKDGRYALCQSAPATGRLPVATDVADIVLVDTHDDKKVELVGQTSAWCHQQGAHAQFVPGTSDRIIYNIFDNETGSFASKEVNLASGKERHLSRPISALSPDGKTAASLNFSRLYDYRPGYGYAHMPDPFVNEHCPHGDGIWLMNLESGSAELMLSYKTLSEFLRSDGFEHAADEKLVVNHLAFNTDGTKLLLLLRLFSKDAPFPTFTLVCNTDGSGLKRIFGFTSHYHWKNENTLVVSGGEGMTRKAVGPLKVFEISIETGEFKQIGKGSLTDDGHCSYSPDRDYLLYDSYCNNVFPYRRLQLFRLADEKVIDLGFFFSPPRWSENNTDLRTDLHPRWSPDGKKITFDSIHEGYRGVYSIDVEEAVAALDEPFVRLSKQDFMKWYERKYAAPKRKPEPLISVTQNSAPSPATGSISAATEEELDRLWLVSLLETQRANQSFFVWKKIPKVSLNQTLQELAQIARKFAVDLKCPKSFDNNRYLSENLDVAEAVKDGKFKSGYEHYALHGHAEYERRRTTI